MSVIVKGMEMPKSCDDCLCYDCWGNKCLAKDIYIDNVHIRSECCPLVEVPTPHGDLIDRNSLIDEINHMTIFNRNDYENVYDVIANFETEIEAED